MIRFTDNIFFRLMGRMADLVILNLLWLCCSLPVVTMGAATAALYSVMLRLVKNEEGYIFSGFFKAFRENFIQSTLLWILLLAGGIMLGVDLWILGLQPRLSWLRFPLVVLLCLILSISIYALALQARFENTVRNTLKNACILTFAKLPYTFLLLILTAGPVILTFSSLRSMAVGLIFWSLMGVSLVSYLNSQILRRIFDSLS